MAQPLEHPAGDVWDEPVVADDWEAIDTNTPTPTSPPPTDTVVPDVATDVCNIVTALSIDDAAEVKAEVQTMDGTVSHHGELATTEDDKAVEPLDDLPVMLINWSMASGTREDVVMMILEDLDGASEQLFNSQIMYHSTESRWSRDADLLEKALPKGSTMGMLPYPARPYGEQTTKEVWAAVVEKSTVAVVNDIRKHIAQCNRPLMWKSLMALEIETYALGKIEETAQQAANGTLPAGMNDEGMTMVDQVMAMVLSRCHNTAGDDEETHYKRLAEVHSAIREGWFEQVGPA